MTVARDNLLTTMKKVTDYFKARPLRDGREPRRDEKHKLENKLMAVFKRRFEHQERLLATRLPVMLGERKTIIDYTFLTDDNIFDDAERAEILRLIVIGAKAGISLFQDAVTFGVDWSKVNTRAAEWAARYVGELIKGIDSTTLDAVRQAVTDFISTPGMTIGDLVDSLPFDEQRAWRIAITETTRAYAEGQREAGDEMAAEFPDVLVVKQWFTNNDDLVCDICGPMEGEEVDHDEAFSSGDDIPPAHVNCRCWIDYRTRING